MGKDCRRLAAALCLGLLLSAAVPYAHAEAVSAQAPQPLAEVAEAYRYLLENHIDRPAPAQLVRGALAHVAKQANEASGINLKLDPQDDTLAELTARLQEWQQAHGLDWGRLHRWAIRIPCFLPQKNCTSFTMSWRMKPWASAFASSSATITC